MNKGTREAMERMDVEINNEWQTATTESAKKETERGGGR